MSLARIQGWITEHKWAVAAALVIVLGYTFGKDLALRDNARDAAQHSAGAQQ